MILRRTVAWSLGAIAVAVAGALAQAPPTTVSIPGPLDGGENGAVYHGPGFNLYLASHWTVTLDDKPEGLRGERGSARGPVQGAPPESDATMRFEPFPLEPGERATLAQFEAHIRSTLAAGVPVGVQPLLPRSSRDFLIPCGDEPEGITLLFTRPGPDGSEDSQRRYFAYAYPRPDGRLQTLVCSHVGRAERGFWGIFTSAADELSTSWPDSPSVYRNEGFGVVLPVPKGWRQCGFYPGCGTGFPDEEEWPHLFMPVTVFTVVDPSLEVRGLQSAPRVELHVVQDLNRSLGAVMDSFGDAGKHNEDFVFADGAVGRVAQNGPFTTILRRDGRRFAKLSAINLKPEEQEQVLALARGLQLVERTLPERRTDRPKELTAQGVTITYPGDWTLERDSERPRVLRGVLSGAFAPLDQPKDRAGKRTSQTRSGIYYSIQRLDEWQADLARMSSRQPTQKGSVVQNLAFANQPFTTDSGWTGSLWTMTNTVDNTRGRSVFRSILYTLPMPDGVTALCFSGSTATNQANEGSAEKIEQVWRKIVSSARLEKKTPATAAGVQKVSQ